MRVPVYPRGANPRTTRRILKKSLAYAEKEVLHRRADWADPADPSKGIVPREFLASGKVYSATPEQIDELTSPPPDAGLKFIPPPMQKNPTLPRVNVSCLLVAAPTWDWTMEPATA
jgi:hypothetical protein